MTTQTQRTKSEGTRGPRKGEGGRPTKTVNRRHRSLQLCTVKEWPRLFKFSTGLSYTDRVRDVLVLAGKSTAGQRSKLAKRWRAIISSDRKGSLAEPRERSIYLGDAEWDKLAKLCPLGSWADKIRQAMELCEPDASIERYAKEEAKARARAKLRADKEKAKAKAAKAKAKAKRKAK